MSHENKQGTNPSVSASRDFIKQYDNQYDANSNPESGEIELNGSPVGHATEKEAREAAESLRTVIATAKFVSKKSDSGETEKDKNKDK